MERLLGKNMTSDIRSRLVTLQDRERILMIADVQAVRKGIDAGGIHQELAAIRLEVKAIRRTLDCINGIQGLAATSMIEN